MNATRCFGLIKPLISPISAISVIAVNKPIPAIELIKSGFCLICPGKSVELRRVSISFSNLLICC